MYIYISEQETFTDFNNPESLFWLEEELVYGDWTAGEDGDGSYIKNAIIPLSEVIPPFAGLYHIVSCLVVFQLTSYFWISRSRHFLHPLLPTVK